MSKQDEPKLSIAEQLDSIELHATGQARFLHDQEYKGFLPNQVLKVFIIHYKYPISIENCSYYVEYIIGKDIYSDPSKWMYFKNIEHVLKYLEFSEIKAQKSHVRTKDKRENPLISRLRSY